MCRKVRCDRKFWVFGSKQDLTCAANKAHQSIDHRRRCSLTSVTRWSHSSSERNPLYMKILHMQQRCEKHETKKPRQSACMCVLSWLLLDVALFIYLGCHETALTREGLKGGTGATTAAAAASSSSSPRSSTSTTAVAARASSTTRSLMAIADHCR